MNRKPTSTAPAGSITDEQFRNAFTAVPPVQISSGRQLVDLCDDIARFLSNTDNDWNKRVKEIQKMRSLLVAGAADYPEFTAQCMPMFEAPFLASVKDLRSQVCREACISVAFYAQQLGVRFWRICEPLMPTLMNLMQNSAKVMSTSAINANQYIAKNVCTPKLLTVFQHHQSSKSRDIRRNAIDLFTVVLNSWEPSVVEKNLSYVETAIKTALYDADPMARENARRAFQTLQNAYPKTAELLVQGLEPVKQRALLGGIASAASSSHSINSERDTLPNPRVGLYNAQSHFYANRSTSDLNPSVMKKLNLGGTTSLRPSRTPITRKAPAPPPQAKPTPPRNFNIVSSAKKNLPIVSSASKSSTSKSISQPSSRSGSPGRLRVGNVKSRIPAPSETRSLQKRDQSPRMSAATDGRASQAAPKALQKDVLSAKLQGLKNIDFRSRHTPLNSVRTDSASVRSTPLKTNGASKVGAIGAPPPDAVFSNGYGMPPSDIIKTDSKWYYESPESLANDLVRQEKTIRDLCDTLAAESIQVDEKETEKALSALLRMIRDDAITQWDDHFTLILITLLQVVDDSAYSTQTKLSALRTLKVLIQSQHKRFAGKQELITVKVLNAHNSSDAQVMRGAEECAAALAAHLPKETSIRLLLPVMEAESSPPWKVAGAIKMLSRVVENLSKEEIHAQLNVIIPRLMNCYGNPESMVRRACVICLVAVSDAISMEPLKPYLNAQTVKLVQVYRERMEKNQ